MELSPHSKPPAKIRQDIDIIGCIGSESPMLSPIFPASSANNFVSSNVADKVDQFRSPFAVFLNEKRTSGVEFEPQELSVEEKIDSVSPALQSSALDDVPVDTTADETPTRAKTTTRQDPNESFTSTGSLREEDILRTQEELGASSLAFIRKLRGAAFRRKMDLTRSRDSLAAKEKEQREVIAAYQAAKDQRRQSDPSPRVLEQRRPLVNLNFKARPLPATTGFSGHGGMAGVPRVAKKPVTTAFSPLLGARRQTGNVNFNHVDSKPDAVDEPTTAFRALPLPPTTGQLGHGGQSGIPKVPKRPATVPFSPLLGARRPKPTPAIVRNENLRERQTTQPPEPQDPSMSSRLTTLSRLRNLVGLSLLGDMASSKENRSAYQPHSSSRAQRRAEYEVVKSRRERDRLDEENRNRNETVKALRKELRVLRKSL